MKKLGHKKAKKLRKALKSAMGKPNMSGVKMKENFGDLYRAAKNKIRSGEETI